MDKKEYYELNLEVCRIQSLLEDVLTENEAFHATEMYNKMLDEIGGLLGISKEEQNEIYQHSLDLMEHEGYKLGNNYNDCGQMMFNNNQKTFQGGSGAGCSAIVLNSYVSKIQ